MMMKLLLIASYLLVLGPLQAHATVFQYQHDLECEYPVSADILSMTCNGSEMCYLGDDLTVYGSITLEESLPTSTLCMTVRSCLFGVKFLCKVHQEKVDVCETLGMSSNNAATACPSAGSFYFDYTMELPTDGDWMIFGSGWWVKVFMTLNDCNEYSRFAFGCTSTFNALTGTEVAATVEEEAEYAYAAGAIVIVAGIGYLVFRKRRVASLEKEEEEEESPSFEMMSEAGVRA